MKFCEKCGYECTVSQNGVCQKQKVIWDRILSDALPENLQKVGGA